MTFEELRNYHRTFVWNSRPLPLDVRQRVRIQRIPDKPLQSPRQAPTMGMPTGRLDPTVRRHDAYLVDETHLEPIVVEERKDQQFSKYATRWELVWSRLSTGWTSWRFIPIVDQDIMVIGHVGVVPGKELVFDDDDAHSKCDGSQTIQELLELGPVLVGTEQFYKEGNKKHVRSVAPATQTPTGYGINKYAVQTDIDGRVTAAELVGHVGDPGAESVDFAEIVSLVSLARGLLRVGLRFLVTKVGTNGAKTIARILKPKPTALPLAGRARVFAKPTTAGSRVLPPGTGSTDKFGNVTYSTLGSAEDVALARFHESVHSFLSPKLNVLRTMRADLGMAGYTHSRVLRYIEEALAETYAQLRVKGFKGLPTGIAFPIKNGYVTLSGVAIEGAVATIVVGGTTYGVYYFAHE